ncbi:unnamed protein product [Heligmosomoides polygyrus]|uniref:Threonine aspartase 1 n=1 Tax=Heligmosomoides polygyrus TaxID=6339 RepID=A0A183FE62_HELPZ|nr:unnamed protein product [Heligmosomoides polygyrus]
MVRCRTLAPAFDVTEFLEDNALFNCGYGSNPTMSGTVECEAGFMSSEGFRFGAVGAVTRLQNPCQVAKAIAYADDYKGLVRPMALVGVGAEQWAEERGFPLVDPEAMITNKTTEVWKKARAALDVLESLEDFKMDTVGAVSITEDAVEACTSSGGIMLKTPGRLGHCTAFGSGMWAERRGDRSIAVSVSGCGEALSRANFSRSLAVRLLERGGDELPSTVITSFFECDFLGSSFMSTIASNRMYAGGLVMLQEEGSAYELIIFHNTPVFPFAYCRGSAVRKGLSQLPVGHSILVESYTSK